MFYANFTENSFHVCGFYSTNLRTHLAKFRFSAKEGKIGFLTIQFTNAKI